MQTESLSLDQLLRKVEQGIKDHGYTVIWSTDKMTDLYYKTTGYFGLPDGTNAVTNTLEMEVIIRTDLSKWETIRSLTHELGHVVLNAGDGRGQNSLDEWEAECFSQAVLEHYGLDRPYVHSEYLSGYSFLMSDFDKNTSIGKAQKAASTFISA